MKKRWIHFTERQDAVLVAEAKRRDVPVSEIVRQIVTSRFGLEPERVAPGIRYQSPEIGGYPVGEE